jgi:hypothetical protein
LGRRPVIFMSTCSLAVYSDARTVTSSISHSWIKVLDLDVLGHRFASSQGSREMAIMVISRVSARIHAWRWWRWVAQPVSHVAHSRPQRGAAADASRHKLEGWSDARRHGPWLVSQPGKRGLPMNRPSPPPSPIQWERVPEGRVRGISGGLRPLTKSNRNRDVCMMIAVILRDS